MQYNLVICGGTFDHLHKGHKAFLRFVFSFGKNVIIGLTTDAYIQKYKSGQQVQPYSVREEKLKNFLQTEKYEERTTIVPIDTIYGPTLDKNVPIEAIVVTEDTQKGATQINQEREKQGLSTLSVISMPLIIVDTGPISASSIRSGLVNEEGKSFVESEWLTHTYYLPEFLRETLHKPFGRLLTDGFDEIKQLDPEKIICVGDVTVARFNKMKIFQKLSVVDFIVERKRSFYTIQELGFQGSEEIIDSTNPAGYIKPDTWEILLNISKRLEEKKRFIIKVSGEEDLFVIPLILCFPLGYHIFYGQPHHGLVQIEISLETKNRIYRIFQQFKQT